MGKNVEWDGNKQLIKDLNIAKIIFQQKAILAAMGIKPEQVKQLVPVSKEGE